MPYVAPTPEEFLASYPEFQDLADQLIIDALARGGRNVDTTWFEDDYQTGLKLYAAHWLTLGTNAADTGGASGEIASETLGRISVSYVKSDGTGGGSGIGGTAYGQQYMQLLSQNRSGPRVV